ncbi:membrane-spanning 4-domains subfamily A member 6E isoform X2 [Camelus bactrianus]|uniref:Membrane-spanning 4-domains subfamily A member 6E isoform X2 n=1 Tax=Camelus bactrianus TaxID=9837 RepID=A0AC58R0K3_CAMBA
MIPQPVTNESVVVLTPSGIYFPSAEKLKPTTQRQASLEKCLKAEIKVLGAQSTLVANILSSLSALAGFILLSVKLAALGPAFRLCDLPREELTYHHFYPLNFHETIKDCYLAESVLAGTLSLMLICTVLEFFLAVLAAVAWQKQARSDSPESVLFLPEGHKNKSSTTSKAPFDPDCEELLTP